MDNEAFEYEKNQLSIIFERIDKDLEIYQPKTSGYETFVSDEEFIDARTDRNASIGIRSQLLQVAKEPYFGRIFIKKLFSNNQESENFAIGRNFYGSHGKTYVYDWRSDVGNLFYLNNISEVDFNKRPHKIEKKRNVKIENRNIVDISDINIISNLQIKDSEGQETEAGIDITDPFLLKVLEERKSRKEYLDIIQTIQSKQNYIIRSALSKGILLKGCAGSGKTMIILHKISYLLYKEKYLSLDSILLIIPSEKYREQISGIIDSLNLKGLKTMTFDEVILHILGVNSSFIYVNEVVNKSNVRISKNLIDYVYNEEFSIMLKNNYLDRFKRVFDSRVVESLSRITEKLRMKVNFNAETSARDLVYLENSYVEARRKNKKINNEFADLKDLLENPNEFSITKYMKEVNAKIVEVNFKIEVLQNKDSQVKAKNEEGSMADRYNLFYLSKEAEYLALVYKDLESRKIKVEHKLNELQRMLLDEKDEQTIEKNIAYLKTFETPSNLIPKIVELSLPNEFREESKNIFQSKNTINNFVHYLYYTITKEFRLIKYKYVHVDEYQDFSLRQLQILKNLANVNAVFNFYGDSNQSMNKKTVEENTIRKMFLLDEYELTENYRNSVKITEYANKKLDLNMYPISISGEEVQTVNKETFLERLKNEISDKSNRVLVTYMQQDEVDPAEQIGLTNDRKILESVDLIPVFGIKGLEYDVVFVFTENMTRNMQYVAYTRALSKLYVIE